MKKLAWCLLSFFLCLNAYSQWTTSGNNIYNSNTGNIGIGTTTPAWSLHIKGKSNGQGTRSLFCENSVGAPTFYVDDLGLTTMVNGAVVGAGSLNIHAPNTNTLTFTQDGATDNAFLIYTYTDASHHSFADVGNDSIGFQFDAVPNSTPLRILTAGGAAERMAVFSNGHIGINVNNTDNGNLFQVNGNLWTTGLSLPTGAAAGKVLTSDGSGNATWQTPTGGSGSGWALNGNTDGAVKSIGTADNYDFPIITNSVERMRVTAGGSLAIGTTNPQGYLLAVNGSAIFTAAWVKPNGSWPDYVFKKGYQLPGLDSLSKYIAVNKHLPDLPSAETVAKTGIDLGSTQAALLKKIEEMTLYMIEQDKAIQDYKQKFEDQERRMERLEKLLKP